MNLKTFLFVYLIVTLVAKVFLLKNSMDFKKSLLSRIMATLVTGISSNFVFSGAFLVWNKFFCCTDTYHKNILYICV